MQQADTENPFPTIEAAQELRDLGKFEEAEAMYKRVLGQSPKDFKALMELGQLLRRRGDRNASLPSFEAAVAADPPNPWAKIEVAQDLRELGRLDAAEAVYRRVLADAPTHLRALMGLGYVQRQRGDVVSSLASFVAAAAAHPLDSWPKVDAAEDLRRLGRLAESEEMYRSVLASAPKHLRALIGLGQVLRQRGDRNASLAVFVDATVIEPGNPWPKIEAAQELRDLKRFDEAEAMYKRVLADAPTDIRALMGLGYLLRRRGDPIAALTSFEAAISSDPGNPWPKFEAAQQLRELGRLTEAEAMYRRALLDDPTNLQALIALGYLLCDRSRWAEADAVFKQAIGTAPTNPAGHLGSAHVARALGNPKGSLAHLEAAAAIDPSNTEARIEIAAEQINSGQLDQASYLIDAVLEENPDNTKALIQRGILLRQQNEHRAALESFEKVIELQPDHTQALIEIAVEHRALGRTRDSALFLQRALKQDPNLFPGLMQAAEHARLAEKFDEALKIYRHTIVTHPHSIWPYLAASGVAAEMGNIEESARLLDIAHEKFGDHPELLAKRVEALRHSRNWTIAREKLNEAFGDVRRYFCLWSQYVQLAIATGDFALAETALNEAPATSITELAQVCLFRGQLAEAQWKLKEALGHYEKAATINPNDNWPHYEAARLCVKIPDPKAMRTHLRSFIGLSMSTNLLRGLSTNISQSLLGQILDEFNLDQKLLSELLRLRELPFEQQLGPLQRLFEKDPDHTPSAILLMVALRQSGRFDRKTSAQKSGVSAKIPRRIIQFWDSSNPPKEIKELADITRGIHSEFEYTLFNDNSARHFIAAHYPAAVSSAFMGAREPAQRADLFRLAYLNVMGGYYVDVDDRCLARIDSYVTDNTTLCLYQEDYGTIGNDFMGAVPRHIVVQTALDLAVSAINRGDKDMLWLCTGPGLITRVFAQFAAAKDLNSPDCLEGTIVFDLWEVQRFVGLHCILAYKKTKRHWMRSNFMQTGSFDSAEEHAG